MEEPVRVVMEIIPAFARRDILDEIAKHRPMLAHWTNVVMVELVLMDQVDTFVFVLSVTTEGIVK